MGKPCPPRFNPADFFVQTVAFVPGKEAGQKEKLKKICNQFNNSDDASLVRKIVDGQWQLATNFSEKDDFDSLSVDQVIYLQLLAGNVRTSV